MNAPYREPVDVGDLPDTNRSYPIIVTDIRTHVIWVEGDSQDAAFERARYDTYEYLDDQETLADQELRLRRPGDDFHSWDWETVYEGEYLQPYQGRRFDAHIEAWKWHHEQKRRVAEAKACVERGHPKLRVNAMGSYCPTLGCGWLERAS